MDIRERLRELARTTSRSTPVVSVYLNTRWGDEHQRERVRVFLKNELRRAREAATGAAAEDLAWVEEQGERLINQATAPEASGVALFAAGAAGLREVLPVRVPFDDALVVAPHPHLAPLAALLEAAPPTVVAFLDGTSARLVVVAPDGQSEAVTLESEVDGRHSRGGWAQLAQSKYQRHIQMHRGEHFEAVSAALAQLVDAQRVRRIVLAGEGRTIAVFQRRLPPPLAGRVAGTVAAAKHESTAAIVARATAALAQLEGEREAGEVGDVLTQAAKGGRAVAGVERTLEAATRGAIHRLFVLRTLEARAGVCDGCGVLQPGEAPACLVCGAPVRVTRLADAVADRVVAAGGSVEVVASHADLGRAGGLAARLRYPL